MEKQIQHHSGEGQGRPEMNEQGEREADSEISNIENLFSLNCLIDYEHLREHQLD